MTPRLDASFALEHAEKARGRRAGRARAGARGTSIRHDVRSGREVTRNAPNSRQSSFRRDQGVSREAAGYFLVSPTQIHFNEYLVDRW